MDVLDVETDRTPSWTFKMEGRLLELNTKVQPENKPKFTSFFKRVVIEIQRDQNLYPQGNLINVFILIVAKNPEYARPGWV